MLVAMKGGITWVLVLFACTIGDVDAIQCYKCSGKSQNGGLDNVCNGDDLGELIDCAGYCIKNTDLKTGAVPTFLYNYIWHGKVIPNSLNEVSRWCDREKLRTPGCKGIFMKGCTCNNDACNGAIAAMIAGSLKILILLTLKFYDCTLFI